MANQTILSEENSLSGVVFCQLTSKVMEAWDKKRYIKVQIYRDISKDGLFLNMPRASQIDVYFNLDAKMKLQFFLFALAH